MPEAQMRVVRPRERWLLVAQDGWGLGHVSRQIGLARRVRAQRPEIDFLFLTYSEAAHLIWREGFASLKLPGDEWFRTPDQYTLTPGSRTWLVNGILSAAVSSFRPQVIVIDTYPAGRHGELAPLLRAPAVRVLVARETQTARDQPRYESLVSQFHVVLVPYRQGELDLPLPSEPVAEWVGPIMARSRDEGLSREAARRRLGVPLDGKLCLIGFGGGGNPQYAELEAWALQLAERHPEWTFALPTPPLFPTTPAAVGRGNAVRFQHYPMAECFAAFDAAIATTGSSAYELAHFHVPSILVPHHGYLTDEDYQAKAARITGGGAGFVVASGDDAGLRSAFAQLADDAGRRAAVARLVTADVPNGADRAAEAVLRFITTSRSQVNESP